MKTIRLTCLILSVSAALAANANAANFFVSNLITGTGSSDTLFQNAGGLNAALLDGGVVSLGYFGSNTFVPSSNIADVRATINEFIPQAFGLTGSNLFQVGDAEGGPGYVDVGPPVDGAPVLTGNPLIGRLVYAFVGNAATLEESTAFGLFSVGTIRDESATEDTFLASPTGAAPILGQINVAAFTGQTSPTFGSSTFDTLQLEAVPEPSALLLSAFGALALLRRKR